MAKIIQILDVNSEGHQVRLDDGRVVSIPHGSGDALNVGDEIPRWFHPLRHPEIDLGVMRLGQRQWATYTPQVEKLNQALQEAALSGFAAAMAEPVVIPYSVEFLNSEAQAQANVLSEIVQPHGGELNASSEPSTESGHGDSGTQSE